MSETKQESKVALVATDSPGHERTFKLMLMVEGGWSADLTRMECQRLGEMMVKASKSGEDWSRTIVSEACLKMWNEVDLEARKKCK